MTCEEFNIEKDTTTFTENKIQEIIQTTNRNIYDTLKEKQSINIYNHYYSNNILETIFQNTPEQNCTKCIYETIENFKENIIRGNFNLTSIEEGKDYTFSSEGLLISFTTTYNQKIKEKNYETTINLGLAKIDLKNITIFTKIIVCFY